VITPTEKKVRSIGEKYFLHKKNYFSTTSLDNLLSKTIQRAYHDYNVRQIQSPDSSLSLFIFENFSRLSRAEVHFFLSLGFLTRVKDTRAIVIQILDDNRRIMNSRDVSIFNTLIWLAKQPEVLRSHYLETEVFPYMSPRRMKGLLKDINLLKKFQARLKSIRPRETRKASKTQRVRGYRDHGNLPTVSEGARRKANESALVRRKIEEFLQEEYFRNLQDPDFFVRAHAFSFYKKQLEALRLKYEDQP